MATSKQKRLMNSTNSEQCRPWKKIKFDSSNYLASLKPHIGLKWDQYLRRVVPLKEQIGILWSDLAPFIESKKQNAGLADVTYVPTETFSLESLRGVLSYEVWSTYLTEAEREFLIQFLPGETDEEENVYLLLAEKNHHFGNPFLSWSSSLCCGDIHPDAVLNKEKDMKKNEKAYRINLLNYHSKIVHTLKKWRKRWLSCTDTRNLFRDNPATRTQGVIQVATSKSEIPLLKVAQSVDVSKFVSYIKVSRTQLKHIKRLKQSGDGIQIKHVSRVIGGFDKSHVKPYGALLEDEQRRLHEHWLNMSRNDVPAAFEVLKDRTVLIGKSRKLLSLELEKKNVSVLRKADKLTAIMKELGQPGACENDGSRILQNDNVDHSPRRMLQGGEDQNTRLQDRDDEMTKDMKTSIYHIDILNVEGHDRMVARGTDVTSQTEKNYNVQDQDRNGVSCVDKGISCYANSPDEQNEDPTNVNLCKDAVGVKDEGIKEISYKDTTSNNYNAESQQISFISYTSTHINTIERENLQVQNLDGVSYKGPPVHAHEEDQDLQSINRAVVNHSGHSVNILSEMSHSKENTVIVDQVETGSRMMIASKNPSQPKSSGEQMHLKDMGANDQVTNGEKDRCQMAGPLQPHYNPPEGTYNDSGDSQIRQQYVSSGQQSSLIYLDNGVSSQKQDQLTTSVFPVGNPASVIEPLSNPQSNVLVHPTKDVAAVSCPLQHTNSVKQSTGSLSLPNNCLAQSTPFPRSQQKQELQQLIDHRDNGLYALLHEDKNQDHNGVNCIDKGGSYCANNPDDWNEDLKDNLGVNDEDIQEISNKDTTVNNNSESQEIKSINCTSTQIDTLYRGNTQLEYLDGISYKGLSVHAHEQGHDLESSSNAIVNHNCGRSANISSEMSHVKMNTVIVDQEETKHSMTMASSSATLLPKSYGGQMYVEDFLDLNDQVAKGEKDRWQLADPLQSHCHPPENIMYNGLGGLQITQPSLLSGQQSSSVCLDNGVLCQQETQFAMSVFPGDNDQLQTEDIGPVPDHLQHANAIEQLNDNGDDGLYAQLREDYHADVSFPIKVNPPVSEQHSYPLFASMDHNRHNWFPKECQSHNSNSSGLELGNCLTQVLPIVSSTDGTLLSVISQCKQPPAHMEHEAGNQVGPPQNLLPRTQDANPTFPDTCDCSKNMAGDGCSHVASVGSLDNMQWTNLMQQNPVVAPDFTNKPFGGPWTG